MTKNNQTDEDDKEVDASGECYYGDAKVCRGETWQCETCREYFCETHWHKTSKGMNVECVACERIREEKEAGDDKKSK
jgi:hypothetical protein